MDAQLPIMLAIAMLALRFTIGLGNELAIQGTMIVKADTAPMGIRNIAKYRAPSTDVAVVMALPTAAVSIKKKM